VLAAFIDREPDEITKRAIFYLVAGDLNCAEKYLKSLLANAEASSLRAQ
jgi:hypothetical protein